VRLVEDFTELLFDLGLGAFEMRRQSGIDPFANPQQTFAERREPGAARPRVLATSGWPIRSDQVVISPQACR
jgi:hypothetical protein